jgi:hypothetical protein
MTDSYSIMMNANSMFGRKMTLSEAREELERHGFKIVVDEHTLSYNDYCVPSDTVIGVHSSCRWSMLAKIDVIVVVHEVPDLTLHRIETDLANLGNQPYLDDVVEAGCPPQGVSRARLTILSYLVTSNHIDEDAMNRILRAPDHKWCSAVFFAAQNANGTSFLLETTTPMWGRALYPELRYWAGLVTGRPVPESPPRMSCYLRAINILCLMMVLHSFIVNPKLYLSLPALVLLAIVLLITVREALFQCGGRYYRGRRQASP